MSRSFWSFLIPPGKAKTSDGWKDAFNFPPPIKESVLFYDGKKFFVDSYITKTPEVVKLNRRTISSMDDLYWYKIPTPPEINLFD